MYQLYRKGLIVAAGLGLAAGTAHAQTYFEDFGDTNHYGAQTYGNATVNGGSLRLTEAINSQAGAFVVGGGKITNFTASFDFSWTFAGATADGLSFNLGRVPDGINAGTAWENGSGNGLSVSFDIFDFNNDGFVGDRGIRVFYDGVLVAEAAGAINSGHAVRFRPISITLDPDGTLDVSYNGSAVFTNLATGYVPNESHRFSIAARTGGERSEQRIDNVSINATASSQNLCRDAAPAYGDGIMWYNTTGMTTDGVTDGLCNNAGDSNVNQDVWFCWTAAHDGLVAVATGGLATFDTRLAAYTDCSACPTGLGIIACDDDSDEGVRSRLSFRATKGKRYLIRAGGFAGATGVGAVSFQTLRDCPGDFNHSGLVSVQDIFDFLAAYFAPCP